MTIRVLLIQRFIPDDGDDTPQDVYLSVDGWMPYNYGADLIEPPDLPTYNPARAMIDNG